MPYNTNLRVRGSLIPVDLRDCIEDIQEAMTGLTMKNGQCVDMKDAATILNEALQSDVVRLEIMTFVEEECTLET